METQNNGKTALITGASSGIGRELTRLFAKDGYKLVLVDINQEGMEQLASSFYNQYGTQTTLINKDLASPTAPDEIYAETAGKGVVIDVLVNNAGFGEYGKFATETDLQRELSIVQVNAVALMHLTKLYVKDMVSRNDGKILMLGSEVSVAPNPLMAVYGATKAFIKSFSEAIRNELKDTNITVTVLMPGATNTNFFKTAGAVDVKGADPNKTADPAAVAKEGYEALMSGKDHVVAGWMNKAKVAMSHILPDPIVAASVRSEMTPKEQAEQEQKMTVLALTVGAVVLGAVWFLTRNNASVVPVSSYDKIKYRYKARKAEHKANDALASVSDTVKGAYHHAKAAVEEAVA
ncbi:SDR family NAD(P)-dependent oxidoreductase [Spirosoma lituiforme]